MIHVCLKRVSQTESMPSANGGKLLQLPRAEANSPIAPEPWTASAVLDELSTEEVSKDGEALSFHEGRPRQCSAGSRQGNTNITVYAEFSQVWGEAVSKNSTPGAAPLLRRPSLTQKALPTGADYQGHPVNGVLRRGNSHRLERRVSDSGRTHESISCEEGVDDDAKDAADDDDDTDTSDDDSDDDTSDDDTSDDDSDDDGDSDGSDSNETDGSRGHPCRSVIGSSCGGRSGARRGSSRGGFSVLERSAANVTSVFKGADGSAEGCSCSCSRLRERARGGTATEQTCFLSELFNEKEGSRCTSNSLVVSPSADHVHQDTASRTHAPNSASASCSSFSYEGNCAGPDGAPLLGGNNPPARVVGSANWRKRCASYTEGASATVSTVSTFSHNHSHSVTGGTHMRSEDQLPSSAYESQSLQDVAATSLVMVAGRDSGREGGGLRRFSKDQPRRRSSTTLGAHTTGTNSSGNASPPRRGDRDGHRRTSVGPSSGLESEPSTPHGAPPPAQQQHQQRPLPQTLPSIPQKQQQTPVFTSTEHGVVSPNGQHVKSTVAQHSPASLCNGLTATSSSRSKTQPPNPRWPTARAESLNSGEIMQARSRPGCLDGDDDSPFLAPNANRGGPPVFSSDATALNRTLSEQCGCMHSTTLSFQENCPIAFKLLSFRKQDDGPVVATKSKHSKKDKDRKEKHKGDKKKKKKNKDKKRKKDEKGEARGEAATACGGPDTDSSPYQDQQCSGDGAAAAFGGKETEPPRGGSEGGGPSAKPEKPESAHETTLTATTMTTTKTTTKTTTSAVAQPATGATGANTNADHHDRRGHADAPAQKSTPGSLDNNEVPKQQHRQASDAAAKRKGPEPLVVDGKEATKEKGGGSKAGGKLSTAPPKTEAAAPLSGPQKSEKDGNARPHQPTALPSFPSVASSRRLSAGPASTSKRTSAREADGKNPNPKPPMVALCDVNVTYTNGHPTVNSGESTAHPRRVGSANSRRAEAKEETADAQQQQSCPPPAPSDKRGKAKDSKSSRSQSANSAKGRVASSGKPAAQGSSTSNVQPKRPAKAASKTVSPTAERLPPL